MDRKARMICAVLLAAAAAVGIVPALQGSEFLAMLPGVRRWDEISSAPRCLVRAAASPRAATFAVLWSTALDANAVRILTRDPTSSGKLDEIEAVIERSFAIRTTEDDPSISPAIHAQLTRTPAPDACGIDGVNSICFDRADMAFTPGVLAITRVVTADTAGIPMSGGAVSAQAGQVLDADIYFNPSNSRRAIATPAALSQNPGAIDLKKVLTHEWASFLTPPTAENEDFMALSCPPFESIFAASRPVAQPQR